MFAIGHMALAYLLSKTSEKFFRIKASVPLILVLSLLPDIDIILMRDMHRGPTHSIITAVVIFIPVFIFYRQRGIPYFLSLVSHSLIADFMIGGQLQLLWPLTAQELGLNELVSYYIGIYDSLNVMLELSLFAASTTFLFISRDILKFFRNRTLNLVLVVPILTVLLPAFFGYPLSVPVLLNLPHLFYLTLFSVAVLAAFLPKP